MPKKKSTAKGKPTATKASHAFWKRLTKREQKSRPAVTLKLVKSREKSLGIRLPAPLLKLLRQQNGGYLKDPEFIVAGKTWYLEQIPPLCETWGIESLAAGHPDHVKAAGSNLSNPELIFPLCGDGHSFIALDYRQSGTQSEPQVVYLDIESGVRAEKIADTFEQFLAGHQTGGGRLAVRFDEIDPKTIIGEVDLQTRHKVGRHAISYQARLCLTDTQVILYAHETWEKPPSESWLKYIADLNALDPEWLRIEKNRGYFTTRTSTLFVYVDTDIQPIVGMECQRTTSKDWKNLPCNFLNHLSFESTDSALLEECREKILQACKRLKR